MVSLDEVLASNDRIQDSLPPGLVAVFAGATSGIGEATLKTFIKYATSPRIYLLARNEASAERVIAECRQINEEEGIHFIRADLSSIVDTDRACDEVRKRERAVNLLILSAGEVNFDRSVTSEGLPILLAAAYYTRILLTQNFLPLLQAAASASPLARVVDVAGGTREGPVDTTDFPCHHIAFKDLRGHLISMHTLALETLADKAPGVAFIHNYPGTVRTSLYDGVPGFLPFVMRMVLWLFERWICVPLEEAGERHVYLATSARYLPAKGNASGVDMKGEPECARGSNGEVGSGVYSVGWDGEGPAETAEVVLQSMREDGTREEVMKHTMAEFERVRYSTQL